MKYIVDLDKNIDFAPDNEVAEILQNVRTILVTLLGQVPLFRDFGTSWEHLDKPLNVARSLMHSAIIDAISEFEPRAEVVSVDYDDNVEDAMEGVLSPIVTVEIGESDETESEV